MNTITLPNASRTLDHYMKVLEKDFLILDILSKARVAKCVGPVCFLIHINSMLGNISCILVKLQGSSLKSSLLSRTLDKSSHLKALIQEVVKLKVVTFDEDFDQILRKHQIDNLKFAGSKEEIFKSVMSFLEVDRIQMVDCPSVSVRFHRSWVGY
ncbi:hypothetical protein [Pseudobacteriovorax antillogorgiicola]|uniref:Uncharacterized protein n=1 Tax=Pseudobacteriovorax antillogorgiicola TaxID=1513793 RepID=A0A1Y6CN85_9BACT|nr:hypothetical protein [Pseudobacteriovorax antillogorgiicola]TCS44968.1 hypothetical protein EDD56_1305 [Pseudobacteriovorax antillogorgiicola]SMF76823.1 hypothetical protein SAMN06296036_13069 [Pseudobacteriovorax antillogorgiicola]